MDYLVSFQDIFSTDEKALTTGSGLREVNSSWVPITMVAPSFISALY